MRFTEFLLQEDIVTSGDDNVLGRLLHDAKNNLNKIKGSPEMKDVIKDILGSFKMIEQNPGTTYNDGYSVIQYLQMVVNPKVEFKVLQMVRDALSSYGDNNGE